MPIHSTHLGNSLCFLLPFILFTRSSPSLFLIPVLLPTQTPSLSAPKGLGSAVSFSSGSGRSVLMDYKPTSMYNSARPNCPLFIHNASKCISIQICMGIPWHHLGSPYASIGTTTRQRENAKSEKNAKPNNSKPGIKNFSVSRDRASGIARISDRTQSNKHNEHATARFCVRFAAREKICLILIKIL